MISIFIYQIGIHYFWFFNADQLLKRPSTLPYA